MVVLEMTEETAPVAVDASSASQADGQSNTGETVETGQQTEQVRSAGDNSTNPQADSSVQKTEGEASAKNGETIPVEPKVDKTQDDLRRYQAERDKIEQYAKELVKKVSPYVDFDEWGNPIGPKKQTPVQSQEDQQRRIAELVEASQAGDAQATQTLLWIAKEQAKNEAKDEVMKELRNSESFKQEIEGIKKDFPDLYKDGKPDEESPLYKEVLAIFNQRPYLRVENPRDVRVAALEAENRLIKKGLPDLENKIRQQTLEKSKVVASSLGTATTAGTTTQADDLKDALTDTQVNRLKKEGYDETGRKRIANLVKQAKKEGGYYL
jgi:hypothetical protein